MQTFRPSEVDLAASAGPAASFGDGGDAKATVTHLLQKTQSPDGGLRSGVWESFAGRRDYVFPTDEWAYILEGEASVTASGTTHQLSAGDVFHTPAGERMTWDVPTYVKKVWVHRRPPLTGRIKRKLRKVVAARLNRG